MPEYLAPGVYVEETSYRSKSIEGVSTSTAGFVGPTRSGPTTGAPEVLTSFAAFESIYGGAEPLAFGPNYVAHAARAFFSEGGARLYVVRVLGDNSVASTATTGSVTVTARHPGTAGDMAVGFTPVVGNNILTATTAGPTLMRTRDFDSVIVLLATGPVIAQAQRDAGGIWTLTGADGAPIDLDTAVAVYSLKVAVEVARPTIDTRGLAAFTPPDTIGVFSSSPDAPDGIWQVLADDATGEVPPVFLSAAAPNVGTLTAALFPAPSPIDDWWLAPASVPGPPIAPPTATMHLSGGRDGDEPTATRYSGDAEQMTGLAAFEAIEDVSIVAAPGSTELTEARGVRQAVIVHCERMRYRAAVLDVPRGSSVNAARDWRNETASTRVAVYYPWVAVPDPFVGGTLLLPPSGFVAGIWARNDIQRAVFKAPANEVIRSAVDLERRLTKGQQDVLNPESVNCLRFFSGRGNLVWGARTMTDDPEWKYISVRRYLNYLEHSIDNSTQWAVFESNGDALWANVRRTIEDFLVAEWKTGALLGREPAEAFFVRCDRTTMTQNDLDNGRLVCLIGVAVVKPAEYVIFRIGQWTATATN